MPDEAKSDTSPNEPLYWWERALAGLLGTGLGGLGAWSVFKSSNQAGSVALIAIGGLLILMAINGTPLLRAKFKDSEWELAQRERRRKVASEAVLEPANEARRLLDVLTEIDPGSRNDPAVAAASSFVYENEVIAAIDRIYSESRDATAFEVGGGSVDVRIDTPEGRIGVETKYRRSRYGLTTNDFDQILAKFSAGGFEGGLIITNEAGSAQQWARSQRRLAEASIPTGTVLWTGRDDDPQLRLAVDEMRRLMRDAGRDGHQ